MRLFRYIFWPLLLYKIIALSFSFTIYVFIDLSYRLRKLSALAEAGNNELSWWHVLRFYFYDLPIQWSISLPAACLIACTAVVVRLQHRGEIHAMKTLGCSTASLMAPLLLLGLLASLCGLWIEQVGVSWGAQHKYQLYSELEGPSSGPSLPTWTQQGTWFYSYGSFDPQSGIIHEFRGYQKKNHPPFDIETMAFAPELIQQPSSGTSEILTQWIAPQMHMLHFASGKLTSEKIQDHLIELPHTTHSRFFAQRRAKQFSLSELRQWISSAHPLTSQYRVAYYEKIAMIVLCSLFPFLILKFLYLAPRLLSLAREILLTLIFSVLFWLLLSLTKVLVLRYSINAAWVAVIPLSFIAFISFAEAVRQKNR